MTQAPLVYISTELIRAKEYLEAIVASTSDAILTTDMDGQIVYFSPGAEKMFGKTFREAVGTPVRRLYRGGRAEAARVMQLLLENGSLSDYETVIHTQPGRVRHISMSASVIRDRRGRPIGTLGISKDISRRVELEQRLRALTMTDELTGLDNPRSLKEKLPRSIEECRRRKQDLSTLLIDLDRFKEANDRWGHLEGDRILRETAAILRDCIRGGVDAAFRTGGDEFVIVLPGLGRRDARAVARRIKDASRKKPYARLVSLSVGSATLLPRESAEDLLDRADASMYRSKRRARQARVNC